MSITKPISTKKDLIKIIRSYIIKKLINDITNDDDLIHDAVNSTWVNDDLNNYDQDDGLEDRFNEVINDDVLMDGIIQEIVKTLKDLDESNHKTSERSG